MHAYTTIAIHAVARTPLGAAYPPVVCATQRTEYASWRKHASPPSTYEKQSHGASARKPRLETNGKQMNVVMSVKGSTVMDGCLRSRARPTAQRTITMGITEMRRSSCARPSPVHDVATPGIQPKNRWKT